MTDATRVLNCLADPGLGGPQLMSLAVAQRLRRRGVQTEFLLPDGVNDSAELLRDEGFLVHRPGLKRVCPPSDIVGNAKYIMSFPLSVKRTAELIRRRNIDIVHANGTMNYHAAMGGRLVGNPVLWHFHGYRFPRIVHWFVRHTSPVMADHLVFSSRTIREILFAENDIAGQVIRPPVDTEEFNPRTVQSQRDLREELNVSDDVPILGTVGNINPAKGYESLLHAVKSVIETWGEVVVPIAGGVAESKQDYAREVRRLRDELGLDGNVFFLGWESEIKEILDCFDVFVLPSNMETGPMSLMEAMAMELPVITTRSGVVNEVSAIPDFAWVVPPGDPDVLADAIRDALNAAESWERRGRAGRQCAIENFSLERCSSEYETLYRALIDE